MKRINKPLAAIEVAANNPNELVISLPYSEGEQFLKSADGKWFDYENDSQFAMLDEDKVCIHDALVSDNEEHVILLCTKCQSRLDFTTQLLKASEGYTIQQLSDLTGLDKSNVHKMLNGKSNPSIDTILKVTNALNQDIIVKPRNNK